MRILGTFPLVKQAELTGCTIGSRRDGNFEKGCFQFKVSGVKMNRDFMKKVSDVKYYSGEPAYVTLVAIKFVKQISLHGPASLRDRTLIYPCERFKCRAVCPCQLCRFKSPYCKTTRLEKPCSGDCLQCREDCQDHLMFHRAYHTVCKFCVNVESHIPNYSFMVIQSRSRFYDPSVRPRFSDPDVLCSAWMLRHGHTYRIGLEEKESRFSCDNCSKKFLSMSHLRRHEVSVHLEIKSTCTFCGVQFSREDNLEAHTKLVHGDGNNTEYYCELSNCDETFTKKSNFERHCHTKPRECVVCTEIFCTLKQLQQHHKSEHSKFRCEKCDKSFPLKSHLNRHLAANLKTAGGSFKNQCDVCNEVCCTKLDLLKHKKVTHRESPEKSEFECSHCNKAFNSRFGLKAHTVNREEKCCPKCGKVFCNGRDLTVHSTDVHGVRKCEICNVSFYLANYKHHMYAEHQQIVE